MDTEFKQIFMYIAFGFLVLLVIILAFLLGYYYGPSRKKKIEDPKYQMLNDDDN